VAGEAWEAGAAIFPLDHRLPASEVQALLAQASPTVLIEGDERRRLGSPDAREPAAGHAVGPQDHPGPLAALIATSGTSRTPRLVELTRSAVETAVRASQAALGSQARDAWLSSLPLSHIGGLLVVFRGIVSGSPVDVRPRFEPEDFRAGPAAFTSVVPTMLARLMEANVDLRPFRAILVGGSALGEPLRLRAEEAGAHVVEAYGLTESCGGVVYDGTPLPGVQVRISGDQEVQIATPTRMRGYRGDPDTTRTAFTDDGWLRSADAGEFIDGRLRVFGRRDDAILTGGEKVWPDDVEALLSAHPAVASVAVAGRPDAEWGSRIVAWVVPLDPSAPPTLEALRAYVSARAASYRAPRELLIVRELPRAALGKVRRGVLPRGYR
jgi:O-succinylbenzoic acid--CoA ligase